MPVSESCVCQYLLGPGETELQWTVVVTGLDTHLTCPTHFSAHLPGFPRIASQEITCLLLAICTIVWSSGSRALGPASLWLLLFLLSRKQGDDHRELSHLIYPMLLAVPQEGPTVGGAGCARARSVTVRLEPACAVRAGSLSGES